MRAEGHVASVVETRRTRRPDPTPIFNTDAFRIGRSLSAGEISLPEIQPSDIEEIPGYELLGVLGRGGMGIVFRARQVSLKRQVALKMILTGRNARPEDRLRFQKEAEAVARLQHPNIVQIYEVGQQNGLPYYSLEFVNAGSLAQFLGGIPQRPTLAARLVLQLAGAMHYAHKRGIVHRDLKPANILLHMDESRIRRNDQCADTAIFRDLASYVPKISDFGLAKQAGGDDYLRQGLIVGTPSYMAPEQAGGAGGVGPAADVYALGAILYEMLTGRPPFKGTSVQETAQQVLTQDPVLPTQLQPKIPQDLETICLTCLQKDPAARYASAEALGEDVRRFLGNEPILAPPAPLPDRVLGWAQQRPGTAITLVAGALLGASLVYAWATWAGTLRTQRDQAHMQLEQTADHLEEALIMLDQVALREPVGQAAGNATPKVTPEVAKALAFYESVAREGRHKPALAPAAAHASYRLGELRHRLGDNDASLAAFDDAIQLYQHLSATCPDRPDFPQRLHECRLKRQRVAAQTE
jgi:serine/threonine protein kinase